MTPNLCRLCDPALLNSRFYVVVEKEASATSNDGTGDNTDDVELQLVGWAFNPFNYAKNLLKKKRNSKQAAVGTCREVTVRHDMRKAGVKFDLGKIVGACIRQELVFWCQAGNLSGKEQSREDAEWLMYADLVHLLDALAEKITVRVPVLVAANANPIAALYAALSEELDVKINLVETMGKGVKYKLYRALKESLKGVSDKQSTDTKVIQLIDRMQQISLLSIGSSPEAFLEERAAAAAAAAIPMEVD